MTVWMLPIQFGNKKYRLKATIEYQSRQIMRIRVQGRTGLLLETNYPMVRTQKNTRSIQWKIREGSMDAGNKENSRLLMDLMYQLELRLMAEFPISNTD